MNGKTKKWTNIKNNIKFAETLQEQLKILPYTKPQLQQFLQRMKSKLDNSDPNKADPDSSNQPSANSRECFPDKKEEPRMKQQPEIKHLQAQINSLKENTGDSEVSSYANNKTFNKEASKVEQIKTEKKSVIDTGPSIKPDLGLGTKPIHQTIPNTQDNVNNHKLSEGAANIVTSAMDESIAVSELDDLQHQEPLHISEGVEIKQLTPVKLEKKPANTKSSDLPDPLDSDNSLATLNSNFDYTHDETPNDKINQQLKNSTIKEESVLTLATLSGPDPVYPDIDLSSLTAKQESLVVTKKSVAPALENALPPDTPVLTVTNISKPPRTAESALEPSSTSSPRKNIEVESPPKESLDTVNDISRKLENEDSEISLSNSTFPSKPKQISETSKSKTNKVSMGTVMLRTEKEKHDEIDHKIKNSNIRKIKDIPLANCPVSTKNHLLSKITA